MIKAIKLGWTIICDAMPRQDQTVFVGGELQIAPWELAVVEEVIQTPDHSKIKLTWLDEDGCEGKTEILVLKIDPHENKFKN